MTKYFETPWATGGDKTAIPNAVQPGGEVSYTEGYGPDYEADQATDPDAKDVPRQTENQFKFDTTELLKEIQEFGVLPYRADINYSTAPAFAVGSDGIIYISTVANGPATTVVDPVGDLTGTWLKFAGGEQKKLTVITVSDPSWTPDKRTKTIQFVVVGGGGGGGGADGQGAGTAASASSGSGAGYSKKTTSTIDPTYAITIGGGGSGAAAGANDGAAGGTTTIVSASVNLSATGGGGGLGATATSSNLSVSPGAVGVGAGGDINQNGDSATRGRVVAGDVTQFSISGGSYFGGATDATATNFGSGGGGRSVDDVPDNRAGFDGADGVVVIEESF